MIDKWLYYEPEAENRDQEKFEIYLMRGISEFGSFRWPCYRLTSWKGLFSIDKINLRNTVRHSLEYGLSIPFREFLTFAFHLGILERYGRNPQGL